jgi:hypothetical protein
MGVSVIDGTVVDAQLKRRSGKFNLYKSIAFRTADGGSKTIKNLVLLDSLAHVVTPGASGRFYLHTLVDSRGMHGFRGTDGTEVSGFPRNLETALLIGLVANLFWVAVRLGLIGDGVPLLGAALALLFGAGYLRIRWLRGEAMRRFAADGMRPRVIGGIAPGAAA